MYFQIYLSILHPKSKGKPHKRLKIIRSLQLNGAYAYVYTLATGVMPNRKIQPTTTQFSLTNKYRICII